MAVTTEIQAYDAEHHDGVVALMAVLQDYETPAQQWTGRRVMRWLPVISAICAGPAKRPVVRCLWHCRNSRCAVFSGGHLPSRNMWMICICTRNTKPGGW